MTVVWPIAFITFKEGIRNRAVYGITLLALLLFAANLLVAGMMPREVGKVAVDFALSAISLSGLLLVLFIGINLLAKDIDRRTIYMVLARPISRSQYIIGKFFGMCLLIIVTIGLLSVLAALSIATLQALYPNYFERFSWSMVTLAVVFEMLMLILLSALTFLFASFTTSSFVTLVLTVITYIIGQSLSDVKALVEAPQVVGIHVSPLTVKTVQAAYYLFPNLSLFDIKLQAAHDLALPLSHVLWTLSYGVIYVTLAIALASLLFRRKEFP